MASVGASAQARVRRALPAELAEAIRTSAGITIGTAALSVDVANRRTATGPPIISPRSVSMDAVAPASAYTRLVEDGGAAHAVLPVMPALVDLVPDGGLRRGTVISIVGSPALVLALIAEASARGSWCAEIGSPLLGSAAAAEVGVALDRFVRVPTPAERWAEVAAALVDGFDLVVVHPPKPVAHQTQTRDTRRLAARARERGTVLVVTDSWDGAALRLTVTTQRWHGLGTGYGHLAAREVEVTAVGRGSAVRPRQVRLWLPGPDGRVTTVQPEETVVPLSETDAVPLAVLPPNRLAG